MHKFNGNVQSALYDLFYLVCTPISPSLSCTLSLEMQCMHYMNNARVHYAATFDQEFTPSASRLRCAFDSILLLLIIIFYYFYFVFSGHFTLEFSLNFKLPVVESIQCCTTSCMSFSSNSTNWLHLPSTMQLYCAKHYRDCYYYIRFFCVVFSLWQQQFSLLWLQLNWWSLGSAEIDALFSFSHLSNFY